MNTKPDIIILGAGGHGRVVLDLLRHAGEKVVAATDANPALHGSDLDGIPVIGSDDAVFQRKPEDVALVNAVGNVPYRGSSGLEARRALFERFTARGYSFMRVLGRGAVVSDAAVLEDGCHVISGAIINAGAVIGINTIINTGARIDHDCQIGDHAHIAPGAILCGHVVVGVQCHIGAGAVVVQNIHIGDGAVVGAGAVVTRSVKPGATVFGSPAHMK